jgi:hypothetical protein
VHKHLAGQRALYRGRISARARPHPGQHSDVAAQQLKLLVHLGDQFNPLWPERALRSSSSTYASAVLRQHQALVTCTAWSNLATLLPLSKEPALEVGSRGLCRCKPSMHGLALLLRMFQLPLHAVQLSLQKAARRYWSLGRQCFMQQLELWPSCSHLRPAATHACLISLMYLQCAKCQGAVLRRIQQFPDLPLKHHRNILTPCNLA